LDIARVIALDLQSCHAYTVHRQVPDMDNCSTYARAKMHVSSTQASGQSGASE
jgi:hypothetical protein